MTTSADLILLAFQALTATDDTTDAGAAVYQPGDWPTQDDQYPRIEMRMVRETKVSLGRGGPPEFTVTTTLRLIGKVSAPASVDDGGATVAAVALWRLARQVEIAVIGSYPLTELLQHFASVDSQLSYNSDAETHLAGVQIDIGLEFYQGPEDFAQPDADDLTEVEADAENYPPAGATINTAD